MKIGINDGCANGGMMDSLSIDPVADDFDWTPYWTVDVTEQEWAEWKAFLKSENEWDRFWDRKMRDADKAGRK